jgi:hypothetical protein
MESAGKPPKAGAARPPLGVLRTATAVLRTATAVLRAATGVLRTATGRCEMGELMKRRSRRGTTVGQAEECKLR